MHNDDLEGYMKSLKFVKWDRFTYHRNKGSQVWKVYGWIDRADDYKDFVIIIFEQRDTRNYHDISFTTSSSFHSEEISSILGMGNLSHSKCNRVEDTFEISNSVKL